MSTSPCPPEGKLACPCKKTDCANFNRCCLCIDAHRRSGKPPACTVDFTQKK